VDLGMTRVTNSPINLWLKHKNKHPNKMLLYSKFIGHVTLIRVIRSFAPIRVSTTQAHKFSIN
jgi:hypothetical protein